MTNDNTSDLIYQVTCLIGDIVNYNHKPDFVLSNAKEALEILTLRIPSVNAQTNSEPVAWYAIYVGAHVVPHLTRDEKKAKEWMKEYEDAGTKCRLEHLFTAPPQVNDALEKAAKMCDEIEKEQV